MLKCRWCHWERNAWGRRKSGRKKGEPKSNWPALFNHVENRHPEKYGEVMDGIENKFVGKEAL